MDDATEVWQRHQIHLPRTRTVLTWIPKNGCTMLKYSVLVQSGRQWDPDGPVSFVAYVHGTTLEPATAEQIAGAERRVVVLRDPHQRLASAFFNKIVERKPALWRLHATFNIDWPRLTFRRFVELLGTGETAMHLDQHWAPQWRCLIPGVGYDRMFDLRTLRPDSLAAHGLQLVDSSALAQHGQERYRQVEDRCYADDSIDDLLAMRLRDRRSPTHAALYDDRLRSQVASLYAGDLALHARARAEDESRADRPRA